MFEIIVGIERSKKWRKLLDFGSFD